MRHRGPCSRPAAPDGRGRQWDGARRKLRILAAAGATNPLLVTFPIWVGAIPLGALVLGEALLPRHFLGMASIGAGLACFDGCLPRPLTRRRERGTAA